MNGSCRGRWSYTASVLFSAMLIGCGGEQRSGSLPADTSQSSARDTATTPTMRDSTTALSRDTGASAARPESATGRTDTVAIAGRTDTAKRVVTKPPARKPSRPVSTAPAKTAQPDTSSKGAGQAAAAQPARPESSTVVSQPADTAAAAPAQTSAANAPLRDQYHSAPLDTVSQQVYDGWKQFNLNCARCHGEDVQGTTIAPHLIVSLKPDGPINTKELFVQTVCAGRPAKGMPAWCALGMEMPTIEAIYAYVKGRSDAKIHPGRPALKPGS
jgi:mono/diheme cytochrome c family protein